MQDRFKFRAWFKPEYREPIMLYQVEQTYDFMRGEPENVPEDCFGDVLADEDYIVMQCTGLKDKNGKLIYEGDIVNCFDNRSCSRAFPLIEKGIVTYNATQFVVISKFSRCLFENLEDIEVIGNIYENPELLEVQNADDE